MAALDTSKPSNRFDRMEWAGAFGDLGTLIPFVVAYVEVVKINPSGILLSFGVALVCCGLYYHTPFPVQPMKAIGAIAAAQAAQTATITASTLQAASLATGLIWLVLGLTGLARRIAGLVPRHITTGIILGLGIGFMREGIRLMSDGWIIAVVGLLGTLLLLTNRVVPAMFLLMAYGMTCGAIQHPGSLHALQAVQPVLHWPALLPQALSWHDLIIGTTLLALPQVPLTLGNSVIAITEENNRLFPERAVTENTVARSMGIMNLGAAALGGVPMCHGAGGMAGHTTFGARTGGAPVILGTVLIVLALLFSSAVMAAFDVFSRPVLGVILLMTGAQLALGSCDFSKHNGQRFITLVVAAFSMWNVGLALVTGLVLDRIERRGWLRL
jgi:MFS superfamily sulfate permease-like transporter